jgi:hypothetical protein
VTIIATVVIGLTEFDRKGISMKKKLLGLMLVFLLVLGSVQAALAVSSLTQAIRCYGTNGAICVMTLTWTAHTDGSFTSTALTAANMATVAGYYLLEMETDPGSTAPTDLYDIVITASATGYSYDVLGGAGANRSTTVTQAVYPKNTDTYRYQPVTGDTWTLGISGNSQNGATGVIRLIFGK